MATSSPYFGALLGANFKERDQNEISISGIDGSTLGMIIDYCYTCDIKINNDNAEQLMAAASSLELVELEQKCSNFWMAKLDIGNCVDFVMIAYKYNLKNLYEKSFNCICNNFENVETGDIVRIDKRIFEAIFRTKRVVAAEDNIFDSFVRWVQNDVLERSKFVASLSNLIRLQHISKEVYIKGVPSNRFASTC